MPILTTSLSSSTFAVNCAEGDPRVLGRLFEITDEQAQRILDSPARITYGPGRNQLTVPDSLLR